MVKEGILINRNRAELSVISNLELYLCPGVRNIIKKLPDDFKSILEEIRLRVNRPLMVFGRQKDYFVDIDGDLF